jgi:hypothetical protein
MSPWLWEHFESAHRKPPSELSQRMAQAVITKTAEAVRQRDGGTPANPDRDD